MFKKKDIERLDEDELRAFYVDAKRMEKFMTVFWMIFCGLGSVAIICFSIIKEIYWGMSVAVILLITFIYLISKFSKLIEDIFENRIFEEEVEDGEEKVPKKIPS